MRLFRKPPDLEPPPHRVHRPWHIPETELPGVAAISTLPFDGSEQAAVAIIGISAYSQAFEMFVARRIRPGTSGVDEEPTPEARRQVLRERPSFGISVQFSDGRRSVSDRPAGDAGPDSPVVWQRGGGGSSHAQLIRWGVWPLPPPGPLKFICHWPAFGISESRVSIDAQLILDAARQSTQLWPEDQE